MGIWSRAQDAADRNWLDGNSKAENPFWLVARYEHGRIIGEPAWPVWVPADLTNNLNEQLTRSERRYVDRGGGSVLVSDGAMATGSSVHDFMSSLRTLILSTRDTSKDFERGARWVGLLFSCSYQR